MFCPDAVIQQIRYCRGRERFEKSENGGIKGLGEFRMTFRRRWRARFIEVQMAVSEGSNVLEDWRALVGWEGARTSRKVRLQDLTHCDVADPLRTWSETHEAALQVPRGQRRMQMQGRRGGAPRTIKKRCSIFLKEEGRRRGCLEQEAWEYIWWVVVVGRKGEGARGKEGRGRGEREGKKRQAPNSALCLIQGPETRLVEGDRRWAAEGGVGWPLHFWSAGGPVHCVLYSTSSNMVRPVKQTLRVCLGWYGLVGWAYFRPSPKVLPCTVLEGWWFGGTVQAGLA